jgi:hypothetical protein
VEATSFKPSDPCNQPAGTNTLAADQIPSVVDDVLATTQFIDMHTHLFPPSFASLGLWGIDELPTYHYLEAEFFRSSEMTPEQYWSLPKAAQADAIWRALFVANAQFGVEFVGEIVQLKADRSRRQKDLLRGAGHARRVHHGKKQFELVNIHTGAPIRTILSGGRFPAIRRKQRS